MTWEKIEGYKQTRSAVNTYQRRRSTYSRAAPQDKHLVECVVCCEEFMTTKGEYCGARCRMIAYRQRKKG